MTRLSFSRRLDWLVQECLELVFHAAELLHVALDLADLIHHCRRVA